MYICIYMYIYIYRVAHIFQDLVVWRQKIISHLSHLWLDQDLAGAEPTPLCGCNKLTSQLPMPVLSFLAWKGYPLVN